MFFYKSYSGIGGYLGTFLDSKKVKMTVEGMIGVKNEGSFKLEFKICDDAKKLL